MRPELLFCHCHCLSVSIYQQADQQATAAVDHPQAAKVKANRKKTKTPSPSANITIHAALIRLTRETMKELHVFDAISAMVDTMYKEFDGSNRKHDPAQMLWMIQQALQNGTIDEVRGQTVNGYSVRDVDVDQLVRRRGWETDLSELKFRLCQAAPAAPPLIAENQEQQAVAVDGASSFGAEIGMQTPSPSGSSPSADDPQCGTQ